MYGMKEPYFSACIKGRHAGKEQILYACMEKKSHYMYLYIKLTSNVMYMYGKRQI